ncbi:hypothetical protein [Microbacterium oleivorans]|uniref:Uncharacterized protein n=1 Tax=Microbacterium oleivorans TaxID=273677 RepID=A0A7D5EV27_9MICO|nr:hypothetical protein [Microbacterium oleivorans]QLD10444.1 hypothetical protein HW566_00755 [Microbacterium oleivorans]
MSDTEHQPPTPQLTRRQLRELRNTASTPIIVDPTASDEAGATGSEQPAASAPLPRPADPVDLPPAPVPQTSVDLGAPALTRRQARLQEKIRTASIPVITATGEHRTLPGAAERDADAEMPVADASTDETAPDETSEHQAPVAQSAPDGVSTDTAQPVDSELDSVIDATIDEEPSRTAENHDHEASSTAEASTGEGSGIASDGEPEADAEAERHVVSEDLGAELLAGDAISTDVPASFDQLLSRSAAATGAFTTPNALILTQTPDGGPLVAPVTATGEVLITGTFTLPERFGSTGVIPGSADGKEVDAILVDGELPASSSPTPIAASAAISTIKSAEDVIRPPAPEKGSRWTVALAITAGALAVLLAGVLIVALVTGVFQ